MNAATIVEVVNALGNFNLEMTPAQIDKALNLLHQRRQLLSTDAVRTFQIGDQVTFTGRGVQHIGTVTKKNLKTLSVTTTTGMRWKVAGSLLTLHKAN